MPAPDPIEAIKRAATDVPVEPLLLRRWNPRAFSDQNVSEDDLRTLFTAATWAASSYNEQPWRFVVGQRGDEAYGLILRCLTEANQGWAKAAPVLFASFVKRTFTHNDKPNAAAAHDVDAASANLATQATASGCTSTACWATTPRRCAPRWRCRRTSTRRPVGRSAT